MNICSVQGPRVKRVAPLLLIFVLAMGLRLWDLAGECLWYDEAVLLLMAERTDDPIVQQALLTDAPLLAAVHSWILPLTRSEFAVRLVPALLGALLAPAGYALGRKVFDQTTGLAAAFAIAINPFCVFFSREARGGYVFGALAAALAIIALMNVWQRGRFRDWAFYIVALTLCLYSPMFLIPVFLLPNGVLLFLLLGKWEVDRRRVTRLFARQWLLAQCVLLMIYLPGIWAIWRYYGGNTGNTEVWMPVVKWRFFADALSAVTMGYHSKHLFSSLIGSGVLADGPLFFATALVAAILLALCVLKQRSKPWMWYMVFVGLVPIPLMALFSLGGVHIALPRYAMFFAVPFLVLLIHGLVLAFRSHRTLAGLATVGMMGLTAVSNYHGYTNRVVPAKEAHKKYDYREIIDVIQEESERRELPADDRVILHFSKCALPTFVYYTRDEFLNRGVTFPLAICKDTNADNTYYVPLATALGIDSVDFDEAVGNNRYFWLLISRWEKEKHYYDFKQYEQMLGRQPTDEAVEWLTTRYGPSLSIGSLPPGQPMKFFGFARLYLFDRKGKNAPSAAP